MSVGAPGRKPSRKVHVMWPYCEIDRAGSSASAGAGTSSSNTSESRKSRPIIDDILAYPTLRSAGGLYEGVLPALAPGRACWGPPQENLPMAKLQSSVLITGASSGIGAIYADR